MASVDQQIAVLFAQQPGGLAGTYPDGTSGTVDLATIAAASAGSYDLDDGLVKGAPVGAGESGLSLQTSPLRLGMGKVGGAQTQRPGEFVTEQVDAFTFALPLCGNRGTESTWADSDYAHQQGIDSLLECCGLIGSSSGGGWGYELTGNVDARYMGACVFINDNVWAVQDILGTVKIDFPLPDFAVATFTLYGHVVASLTAGRTRPATLDYGVQDSELPPASRQMACTWAGASKAFSSWSLECGVFPEYQMDSVTRGVVPTVHDCSFDGELLVDDGDLTLEHDELVRTTTPSSEYVIHLGGSGTTGAGEVAKKVEVTLSNLEMQTNQSAVFGDRALVGVSGVATATAAADAVVVLNNV